MQSVGPPDRMVACRTEEPFSQAVPPALGRLPLVLRLPEHSLHLLRVAIRVTCRDLAMTLRQKLCLARCRKE